MKNLRILVIDRKLRPEENTAGNLIFLYKGNYDLLLFLEKNQIEEVILFDEELKFKLRSVIDFNEEGEEEYYGYYDYSPKNTNEEDFFSKLNKNFEITEKLSLTSIEKEEEMKLFEEFQKAIM